MGECIWRPPGLKDSTTTMRRPFSSTFKTNITRGGHCSRVAPKEGDGLVAHDSPSKSGPRARFNAELSKRVSREKLELALKGELHAAKTCSASQKNPQANNFALQRDRLTVQQQSLEGFISKIKALMTRLEDSESRQEKEGILEVLRLMLKTTPSPKASDGGEQRALRKCVLVISDDEGEGSESEN
ncbi:hypothetical protein B0H14DRAFT_2564437 [Mycena olivaceomarginata]|nr:hypothetical protein B0H14DRAFT_2564437 [Mycena olivaceomarginata]